MEEIEFDRKSISAKSLSAKDADQLRMFKKVFARLDSIVFLFDVINYRMIWVNDAFKKVLGYKKSTRKIPEEIMLSIYHPNDKDYLKEMKSYLRKNKKGTFTAIYKFRDVHNNYLWFCTSANIFRRTPNESVFEIVGVSINLTDQISYDKNLKVLSKEKLKQVNKEQVSKITMREKEILKYFANGYKTREIADQLDLSFHTISNHRKNILRKLELKNLAAMVNFAVENGLD